MSERVSVLITAHDAAATIERPLRALGMQRLRPGTTLEVVVVDDRSSDATTERARAAAPPATRIVRATGAMDAARATTRQRALELAAAAATGDVLLTLDADAEPPEGWVEGMRDALADGDLVSWPIAFRAGRSDWRARAIAALQTADNAFYLLTCRLLAAAGTAAGVCFGAAGFTRALLDRVRGFAANGPSLAEDLAFARAAHAAGARVVVPRGDAVVVDAAPSVAALVQRALRVSAVGGVSALALTLGLGVATLPVLMLLAVVGVVPWWLVWLRYAAGVVYSLVALAGRGRVAWRAWPVALVYELTAVVAAVAVTALARRVRHVEWGGMRYERAPITSGAPALPQTSQRTT